MTEINNNFIVKYGKSEVVIAILCTAPPYIVIFLSFIQSKSLLETWVIFILATLMFIITVFILQGSFYVEIKDGELIYHFMFMNKRIRIENIEYVRQESNRYGSSPRVWLVIIPKFGVNIKQFQIATYYLEPFGYKRLLEVLPLKK